MTKSQRWPKLSTAICFLIGIMLGLYLTSTGKEKPGVGEAAPAKAEIAVKAFSFARLSSQACRWMADIGLIRHEPSPIVESTNGDNFEWLAVAKLSALFYDYILTTFITAIIFFTSALLL